MSSQEYVGFVKSGQPGGRWPVSKIEHLTGPGWLARSVDCESEEAGRRSGRGPPPARLSHPARFPKTGWEREARSKKSRQLARFALLV
ncbi:hypothetical protein PRIPAC_96461 [Pristionchus pacificus]|uniref:Uncharacterized protein n=1 Tax=Pristionchus pacificus TaxID=54126 RepID=A0A2A6D1P6_PRIPA|nr:hypothetical protein PRIPAC_96461 [Pristionchus pacificus]|eukprot:PDM84203.1 hypothetical protein PRIPAC_33226 [Pristionchus pacificus]